MKFKNKLIALGTIGVAASPVAVAISCSSDNYAETGTIYASRTADIDNLVTLGFQPTFVNKQHDGVTLPSYLNDFVKDNVTRKLHDRPAWDQSVDAENIAAKGIKNAFIAAFQGRLFESLKAAGISKDHIGYSSMGETYVPDMDFKLNPDNKKPFNGNPEGMVSLKARWNANPKSDGAWGKARSTSTDFTTAKKLLPVSGTNKDIHVQSSNTDLSELEFTYTANIKEALKITAETLDRITNTHNSAKKASEINTAFDARVKLLHDAANVGDKTALAIKPNYSAGAIDEIIDTHFTWDPTNSPFLYSETNGIGYEMPKYNQGHGTIEYLDNDVDGLVMDSVANVKAGFAGQVDDLFFLKPANYPFSDSAIQNQLKVMTRTGESKDVHVVSENQYYQSNFGMIGYFTLMDKYASDFNVQGFNTGVKNWGWSPTDVKDLKLSL